MMAEIFRFLHIPKTAGTTFRSILERQFPAHETFAFSGDTPADVVRYHSLPERERTAIALFTGHAPIVSGIKAADEATIITILREPVSRVKSFCQHVSEGKSEYLLGEFPPETFDLDRFLDSGNAELSNLQSKMLLNSGEIGSPRVIAAMEPGKARDAALDALFNRIGAYGIQDHFDESLVLFSLKFGWKAPLYRSQNESRSGTRLVFKDRHTARIRELNAIDMEVYRKAAEALPGVLAEAGCTPRRMQRFRFLNTVVYPKVRYAQWMLSRLRG